MRLRLARRAIGPGSLAKRGTLQTAMRVGGSNARRLLASILLGEWAVFTPILLLRGEYRQTLELPVAKVRPANAGEVELLTGQDETIQKGQDVVLRFVVANGAGATAASWYLASGRSKPASTRLLALQSAPSGPIVLNDVGDDLRVDVPLTKLQTEALKAGRLFHQLWITDAAGNDVPAAEGTLTTQDSLKA